MATLRCTQLTNDFVAGESRGSSVGVAVPMQVCSGLSHFCFSLSLYEPVGRGQCGLGENDRKLQKTKKSKKKTSKRTRANKG